MFVIIVQFYQRAQFYFTFYLQVSKPINSVYLVAVITLKACYCFTYPFGGFAVHEYRTTLEHFIVNFLMSVHCKKYLQLLSWISAVSRKKRTSPSQI
jgi:hypothetical protein